MELVDNEFLRQFEVKVDDDLATVEYALQDRKIFLTKLFIPDNVKDPEAFQNDFLELIFNNIKARNISMVPTSPEIAKVVKGSRKYKRMLPVGIRI